MLYRFSKMHRLCKCIHRTKQNRGEIDDISRWEAYRDFTEHAVMEVEAGELDRWFPPQAGLLGEKDVTSVNLSSLTMKCAPLGSQILQVHDLSHSLVRHQKKENTTLHLTPRFRLCRIHPR